MTVDEAEAVLGPRIVAELRAEPRVPLTREQIELLAPRLACCVPDPGLSRTA